MSRWTFEQDLFLASYFDAVGDLCGTNDLGKPKGAATRRVKKLKERNTTGRSAWDVLKDYIKSDFRLRDEYLSATVNVKVRELHWMVHPGAPEHVPSTRAA